MIRYSIFLEDLTFETIVGILPFERENPQKIKVDLHCIYSGDFLDYRELRDFIKNAFLQNFRLLEDALEYFEKEIPKRFLQIQFFSLKITKLEIFEDCKVAMQVEYKR